MIEASPLGIDDEADLEVVELEPVRKPKRLRAAEPRRAKGMWVPTWLFWLWWVLVLLPSALLVYESVVGW